MLKLFKVLLTLVLVFSLAVSLPSCGGGGSSSKSVDNGDNGDDDNGDDGDDGDDELTREEKIVKELGLPPEPNKSTDAATFLGVDSDTNKRRDKLEREIAFIFYPDLDAIEDMNQMAEILFQLYDAHEESKSLLFRSLLEEQFLHLGCFVFNYYSPDKAYEVISLMFDTNLRIAKLEEMEEEHLSGKGMPFISRDRLEQECPNL